MSTKIEHDGCCGCVYFESDAHEIPCCNCRGTQNLNMRTEEYSKYPDYYTDGREVHEHVNHPNHYNRDGAIECIEEMVEVFGVRETMTFCLLNVWKYRFRAGDKNGIEDVKKSDWYMKKYIELKERLEG